MSQVSRRTFIMGTAGVLATGACSTTSGKRVSKAPSTFKLQRFISDVKEASRESNAQETIEELLADAVSDPSSVIRELGEPTGYEIKPLHKDDSVSIYKLVWPPLTVLVPHDHLMWASIGVYTGREDNIMWTPSGANIKPCDAASVTTKEAFSLPPNAIHSVINPTETYTSAIHVYGGNLSAAKRSQWDPLTHRKEPFDLEDGRRILREADEKSRRR